MSHQTLTVEKLTPHIGASSAEAQRNVAVDACAAGMGAKETTVIAPALVLLYDCTFAAGSLPTLFSLSFTLHCPSSCLG